MNHNRDIRRLTRGTAVLTCASLLAVSIGACESSPPRRETGDSGGRINPYATTPADRSSSAANAASLWEFSDQVADALAARIAQIPEIRDAPYKVVIELGDIENMTNTPRQDFELIQRRLRGRLLTSDTVTAKARFVEGARTMDREKDRVQAGGGAGGMTDRYDERLTYVLRGSFYESTRGGGQVSRYYFEFNLVNLQSRDIVFNESFDLAQQR
ncbi:MAG: hypothetical protein AMXMBFR77_18150 [Phycisphaerales bacterium]|nr:hypothetical protein [Phycisphaerales bacterium]GIK19559.1 MAG: hypothetical protein BroJett004_17230 [Planctomycetota bacterium]